MLKHSSIGIVKCIGVPKQSILPIKIRVLKIMLLKADFSGAYHT